METRVTLGPIAAVTKATVVRGRREVETTVEPPVTLVPGEMVTVEVDQETLEVTIATETTPKAPGAT